MLLGNNLIVIGIFCCLYLNLVFKLLWLKLLWLRVSFVVNSVLEVK